jgi:hypothetical protein
MNEKPAPLRSSRYLVILLFLTLAAPAALQPIQPTGLIHSFPDSQGSYAYASGIYLGDGMLLTNWHVLKSLGWRQEYFKLPLWNERLFNFDIPIQGIVFSEKSLDLAIGKLADSALDRLNVGRPCLSAKPVSTGQRLTVLSCPFGRYPPVPAQLVVTDPASHSRPDRDPLVPEGKRNAAISFATALLPGQEQLIESGSSGGAVFNQAGELVGLLWTRYALPDGSKEVLVTPVSVWLPYLEESDIAPAHKRHLLDQQCK